MLGSRVLCHDSCLNLPTYPIELCAMSIFTVWESAQHLMVESWYYVDVHVEDLLGSSPTV